MREMDLDENIKAYYILMIIIIKEKKYRRGL